MTPVHNFDRLTSEQQEAIHRRAYNLYLQRGASHGRALDDWVLAEQEVLGAIPPNTSFSVPVPHFPSRRPWLVVALIAVIGFAALQYGRYLETRAQLEHTWQALENLAGSHRAQGDPAADLALLAKRLADLEQAHQGALAEVEQLHQQIHQQENQQQASNALQQMERVDRVQLERRIENLTGELNTLRQDLAIQPLLASQQTTDGFSSQHLWLNSLMASSAQDWLLPREAAISPEKIQLIPQQIVQTPAFSLPVLSSPDDRYTLLQLDGTLLFNPGTARLTPAGQRQLTTIAWASQQHPDRLVVVEGHADNRPLGPTIQAIYPSNWELSAARAGAAVRYLEQLGLDPSHLVAVGLGEHHPARPEDPTHPSNRRVEVVLAPAMEQLSQRRLSLEPSPVPPRPSRERYALQLLGSYRSDDLERYANRHGLGDEARIAHTLWEGRDWYVLLYGHYQTITSARQALLGLPETLRSRQPWIRDERELDSCVGCRPLTTAFAARQEE